MYLTKDRLSFMRFLGLGLADPVPDANTIWTVREALTKAGAIEVLFRRFDQALKMSGYLAMGGQIVDATIVASPKQRNTDEEKKVIKDGGVPDAWKDKSAKLAQKDHDARWTVKHSKAKPRADGMPQVDLAIPAFGYKNHVSIDRCHGLIRKWTATDAAAYDGARLADVLDGEHGERGVGGYRLPVSEERGTSDTPLSGPGPPPLEHIQAFPIPGGDSQIARTVRVLCCLGGWRATMARAYSQDLRDRVIDAALGGMPARRVAAQFEIGVATAIVWVRRARASGERTARHQGQPRRSKLDPQRDFLLGLVEQTPDMTIVEMQQQLATERGIKASVGTIWTFLDRCGLTFKKSPRTRRSGIGPTS